MNLERGNQGPYYHTDKKTFGKEFYTAEQVARAQEKATKLGIWRPWLEEERELKRIGGSLVVSIPKAMAKSLDLAPKQKVKMKLTERGISVVKKR